MKTMKLILSVIFVFVTNIFLGQTKYTTYTSNYTKKPYDILLSFNKERLDTVKYTLYIETISMDKYVTKTGLLIEYTNLPKFIESLELSKKKFTEWSTVAKTNNVTQLEKKVDINPLVDTYFLTSNWNFEFTKYIDIYFKIINGKYLIIYNTGELVSSSNEYIKMDGSVLVFTSEQEIDDFINKIKSASVISFIKQNSIKNELFK